MSAPIEKQSRLLREPECLKLVPVSRATWWRGVKSGAYPKPVKISHRCTAWHSADIDALVARLSGKQEAAKA